MISLSNLTMNHHVALTVVLEQIYRSFCIHNNLPITILRAIFKKGTIQRYRVCDSKFEKSQISNVLKVLFEIEGHEDCSRHLAMLESVWDYLRCCMYCGNSFGKIDFSVCPR